MGKQSEIGSRGFTLLELVVALLVIAVAVGLVAPTIGRSLEGLRARSEVAGFSATLRHARERAITSREPHVVVVNPTSRLMTVTGAEDEVRWTRALSPRLTIEAVTPDALKVRFEPQGTSSGGAFRLSTRSAGPFVGLEAWF